MKTFLNNSFYRVDVQYQLRTLEAAPGEKATDADRSAGRDPLRFECQIAQGDGVHFTFDLALQSCLGLLRRVLQRQSQQRYACRRVAQRLLVDQRALYDQ